MLGCKDIQQVGIDHQHSQNRGCVSMQHPFKHLGASSVGTKVLTTNSKTRIQQAFGRLGCRVFPKQGSIYSQKSIHRSEHLLATLLGCCEAWVTYTHLVNWRALSSEVLSTFWESLGLIQCLKLKSQRKTGCRSIGATHF